ncbi:hypothetical protein C8R43DRAFT_1024765 [Mycena crocata]|nr:hypothetical protein C8R43DRAFT_1024765 [Mycena crocata]
MPCHQRYHETGPGGSEALRTRLVDLQKQIQDTQRLLNALQKEAKGIQDDLSSIVYPILSIPNEITAEIFRHCMPVDGRVVPSVSDAPLVLARICRHWRQIALSMSHLWSGIRIDFGQTAVSEHMLIMGQWFQLAKTSPLSIVLEWTARAYPCNNNQLGLNEDFIGALESVSSRLSRVTVQIHMYYGDFQLLVNGPLSSIIHAPNLTELHLGNPVPISKFNDVTENLTSLTARLNSLPDLVKIITRFSKLRDLDVSLFEADEIDDGWDEMHSACELRTLIIREDDIGVLKFLYMPSLHSLSVSISSGNAQTAVEFITRSSSLRHISMSMDDDHVPDFFWSCLTAVQNLELVFTRPYDDSVLVNVLPRIDVLTNLKHLTVRLCDLAKDAFQEDFQAILSTRMSPHPTRTRLLDLTVIVFNEVCADECDKCVWTRVAAQLAPLVLDGFDVRVLYPE